jgi:hypothetical protein
VFPPPISAPGAYERHTVPAGLTRCGRSRSCCITHATTSTTRCTTRLQPRRIRERDQIPSPVPVRIPRRIQQRIDSRSRFIRLVSDHANQEPWCCSAVRLMSSCIGRYRPKYWMKWRRSGDDLPGRTRSTEGALDPHGEFTSLGGAGRTSRLPVALHRGPNGDTQVVQTVNHGRSKR